MGSEPNNSTLDIVEFNPTRRLKKGEIAPFVEMAAIPENDRNISSIEYREVKGGSRFKNGDTLFARITPCLENGKTAKVSGLKEGEIAHGSTEFIVMAAKEPEYDEDFVYYLSRLPEFRTFAQNLMQGTSGRQRVSWQSLTTYESCFPKKQIRKQVGQILKAFDDKIELNRQINQTLEEMAQAIFKSWFVDFEPVKAKMQALENGGTEDDAILAAMSVISGKTPQALKVMQIEQPEQYQQLQQTASLFPSAMQDSELGEIPVGWAVKPLDTVAHYQNGLALQKFRPEDENDFLPVVKIAQLKKGFADGEEKASPNIKTACIIDDGDVIFSWSGTLIVDTWCGGKAALNQHLFKVTSDDYPKWLYYHFTKHHLAEFQRIAQAKAVTMGHIKREHLKKALCAVPDSDLVAHLGKTIKPLFDKVVGVRLENRTLAELRDTLLPKLLSGELQISTEDSA